MNIIQIVCRLPLRQHIPQHSLNAARPFRSQRRMPQLINGSPLPYTDPQAYFTMRDAAKGLAGFGSDMTSEIGQPSANWARPISDASRGSTGLGNDTIAGGGGSNDLVGDASSDPPIPDHFGHPNPLPLLDPAIHDQLVQQADAFLNRYAPYVANSGQAVGAIGRWWRPASPQPPECTPPILSGAPLVPLNISPR